MLGLRAAIDPGQGILPVIQEYLSRYKRQWGIDTALCIELSDGSAGLRQLSQSAEIQLLRIVQEGLTNIRRHANASRVVIRVSDDPIDFRVEIEDNGQGFIPERIPDEKLGLKIMREPGR